MGTLTALLAGIASRSVGAPGGPEIEVTTGLGGGAGGAFLTTLLVGGILVALAPAYTERVMDRFRDEVVGSFVYGIVTLVFLVLATFLLVITILGILFAAPLILLTVLVWSVGASIAFLAIADRLVDREDGWLKPLLVAAVINGGLTLTGVGSIVSFCIGAAGFGAVLQDWQE